MTGRHILVLFIVEVRYIFSFKMIRLWTKK